MRERASFGFGLALLGAFSVACSSSVVDGNATTSGATTTATETTTTGSGGGGQGGASQGGGAQGGAGQGGGVTSSGGGGSGQGGMAHGGSGQGGAPACNGPGPSGAGVSFVLTKLFLGDTDRNDVPSQGAWKHLGMNLDGKVSTAQSNDLCQPRNGASKQSVYPDGDGGIDNSFGKNIVPIFMGLAADWSTQVNSSIVGGDANFLLHLVGLANGGDTCGLHTDYLLGEPFGQKPKLDGTDAWWVRPDGLVDPNDLAKGSAVVFASGDVVGDVFRTTTTADVGVVLGFGGNSLPLPITHARIEMTLDASRTHATMGTIAGVVPTAALTAAIKKVAGKFDPSLCSGPAIDSVVAQLEQASDILADGTQDPTRACDGVSIGLGFEAVRATLAGVGPGVPADPDPCAP
jgi:hypothetical protein